MSNKQDRQGARTPADLERKYNFEKNFAEIMGVALDAQKSVEESQKRIDAELSLKLGKDDNDQIVSMLNASADTIALKSNRLEIQSDHFTLSKDGVIAAAAGNIGGCSIVNGVLEIANANANNIVAREVDISGKITSNEGSLGNIDITEEGLTCGDTFLSSGGIRTTSGSDTTLIAGGVVKFGSGGSFALYAPRSSVDGAFLGVFAAGSWYTLYFDEATGCVKFKKG